MGANPAAGGGAYEAARLYERLADLERRVAMLERNPTSSVEFATVSVYTGGNQCTVVYPSGRTRVVGVLSGFTPVVSNEVIVVNAASGRGLVVGKPA